MSRQPEPYRMAIHQAGHAVAQALVGNQRFSVARVKLGVEANAGWPEQVAWGEAAIDRDTRLTIYEFGLVTLAGIAAEDRFLESQPPEEEPLVALSDLGEWNEQVGKLYDDPAKIDLVSINILRKLHQWFSDPAIWRVVENLAGQLLEQESLEGRQLTAILQDLPRKD